MPLDRVNGEVLDGLPASMHIVVNARHLASLSQLTTTYKIKNKKFGYRSARRPVFDDAVAHALEAFKAAGALFPVRFDEDDVLVQVYPKDFKVAIVFQRRIAGADQYVSRVYDLPAPVMSSLLATTGKTIREH